MALKRIDENLFDVNAWVDEGIGAPGTAERAANMEKAYEEYNAQILQDARKHAQLTQGELAKRIGTDKSYISRVEHGLTVPSISVFYRMAAAMGLKVQLTPA